MSEETALAKRSKSVDLRGLDPEKYNILTPTLRVDTAAHLRVRAVEVMLDSDHEYGDCYPAPGTKWKKEKGEFIPRTVAPNAAGLLKIASAMGLILDTKNCKRIPSASRELCLEMATIAGGPVCDSTCSCRVDVAYQCVGAILTNTGWRTIIRTYEWCYADQRLKIEAEARKRSKAAADKNRTFDAEAHITDRLAQVKSDRFSLAETKALLRTIRAACCVKHGYDRDKFALPFVVVKTELDTDQVGPELQRALAAKAVQSASDIFGEQQTAAPVVPERRMPYAAVAEIAEGPAFAQQQPVGELPPQDIAPEEEEEEALPEELAEPKEDKAPAPKEKAEETPPPSDDDAPPEPQAEPEAPDDTDVPAETQAQLPMPTEEGEGVVYCDDPECEKSVSATQLKYCRSPKGIDEFAGAVFCVNCQKGMRAAR